MATQKKLLIIYYNFPPVKVPGAVRLHHFYQAALSHFKEIHVLTTSNRRYFLQDASLETGCQNMLEVPAWDLRRFTVRKKSGNAPFVAPSVKERPLMRWLQRLVDSFPFNILIGDGGLVYILTGYFKARRLIKTEGITHIFSTFRPYSDHIVGYLLKRRFPGLFWIADFRDLHVDPVRNTLCPAFQRWCNRQVLRRADLVTTVSEGLKRHLEPLAPRVYVLRNGIDSFSEAPAEVESFERFTIAYTGALYEGRRTPEPLFQAISRLAGSGKMAPGRLSILYAGPDQDHWMKKAQEAGLERMTTTLGVISREEALILQRRSHLNLLLTWARPGYQGVLSGKLFEYLSNGRPILALISGSQDTELEEILGHWKENAVFYSDDPKEPERLEEFLFNYYRSWEESDGPLPVLDSIHLEPYRWPHQMSKLIREL